MNSRTVVALLAVALLALAGCSTEPEPEGLDAAGARPDAKVGRDADEAEPEDASTEPGRDASDQPGMDAGQPGADASGPGVDTGTSPGLDASAAGPDAAAAGPDAAAPGPDAGSGPDPATACDDTATAVCAKFQACAPFALQAIYGTQATCKARFVLACLPTFGLPGSQATPAKTAACAATIPGLSCASFVSLDYGPTCATQAGTLANGTACGDNWQCQSTFCARSATSQCGTCAAATTAGGACVNGTCSGGQVCRKDTTTCFVPVAGKVGDPCAIQEECDLANAVACNTSTKKCMAVVIANPACGFDFAGPFGVCPASGSCSSIFPAGSCSPAAADGASCGTGDSDPHCMTPARCVASKCALPTPAQCN